MLDPVDNNDRVFLFIRAPTLKLRHPKEVAMKMLLVIMLVRAVVAFIETVTNKNKKDIRTDVDTNKVRHPAETMLRW